MVFLLINLTRLRGSSIIFIRGERNFCSVSFLSCKEWGQQAEKHWINYSSEKNWNHPLIFFPPNWNQEERGILTIYMCLGQTCLNVKGQYSLVDNWIVLKNKCFWGKLTEAEIFLVLCVYKKITFNFTYNCNRIK